MFFRTWSALLLALALIGMGSFEFEKGAHYRQVAKREASTTGTLLDVDVNDESSNYQFRFQVHGAWLRRDTHDCTTPLTTAGCVVGAPVLVYYDPNHVTDALLEEFGTAGWGRMAFGACIAVFGLLLLIVHFIAKRALAGPDETSGSDHNIMGDGPEIIHVVPYE